MSIIHWPLSQWLDNVALAALSSKETLLATFDLARNVIERGIPGDFVECGVFGGAQCAVMARAIMEDEGWPEAFEYNRKHGGGEHRNIHLFDSFAGVPAPGPHDAEWLAAKHPEGTSICTLEGCQAHMREWGIPDELLVWHPGSFQDTVPDWGNQIALLRLDGDLYESTKICAERLYPLVSPGGWIIVDDFNLSGARKAYLESVPETGPAYFQKQR